MDFEDWFVVLVIALIVILGIAGIVSLVVAAIPTDDVKVELKMQPAPAPSGYGLRYKTPRDFPDVFKFLDERGNSVYVTPNGHVFVLEKVGGI
jgi:hypothetical protein